jgi:hypothetical protein
VLKVEASRGTGNKKNDAERLREGVPKPWVGNEKATPQRAFPTAGLQESLAYSTSNELLDAQGTERPTFTTLARAKQVVVF